MTPERWSEVKRLFNQVMERDPADRQAFLASCSGGDEALLGEVATLLRACEEPDGFLETPAPELRDIALARASAEPSPDSRIGPYRILREIGHGGMGRVFLAMRDDEAYEKEVAIKLVAPELASQFLLRRFRSERQILAKLEHPNIARLLDGGALPGGIPYLVMEYADGLPIDGFCDRHALTVAQRLGLFRQVCAAVHYAHQHLVVHRDLKPGNIIVTGQGTVKLLDFGIARLISPEPNPNSQEPTGLFVRLLTPEYASPEQLRGETITTASDIYSLGIVLYRLLSGQAPFPSGAEACARDREPVAPSVAARRAGMPKLAKRLVGDLDAIVLCALSPEPRRRYASAEQFSEELRRHLEGYPVRARKPTPGYRLARAVHRNRTAAAMAALALSILLAGLLATGWQARVAGQQRARAERRFDDVRRLATSFLFEFYDAIEPLAGATAARQLVVRHALEYLDSLAREAGDDPALQEELATAYQRVGDVQGNPSVPNLGNRDGALRSQRAALAIRERLVSRLGRDKDRLQLSVSHDRIGDLLWLSGSREEALRHYRASLAIRQDAWARAPDDAATAHYLAAAYNNVGDLLVEAGDHPGALRMFRESFAVAARMAARRPDDTRARRDLSVSYNRLGDSMWYRSGFPAALENYKQALRIRQALVEKEPHNAVLRRDLIASFNNIGDTLGAMKDWQGAVARYRDALVIARGLAAADPGNALAARDVAICYKHLAAGLLEARDHAGAREALAAALRAISQLRAGDPGNSVLRKDEAEMRQLQARLPR